MLSYFDPSCYIFVFNYTTVQIFTLNIRSVTTVRMNLTMTEVNMLQDTRTESQNERQSQKRIRRSGLLCLFGTHSNQIIIRNKTQIVEMYSQPRKIRSLCSCKKLTAYRGTKKSCVHFSQIFNLFEKFFNMYCSSILSILTYIVYTEHHILQVTLKDHNK